MVINGTIRKIHPPFSLGSKRVIEKGVWVSVEGSFLGWYVSVKRRVNRVVAHRRATASRRDIKSSNDVVKLEGRVVKSLEKPSNRGNGWRKSSKGGEEPVKTPEVPITRARRSPDGLSGEKIPTSFT